jgi:hypothetical protein
MSALIRSEEHFLDELPPEADLDFEGVLSEHHRSLIKTELEPGERLLWAGRSNPRRAPVGCGFYFVSVLAFILLAAAILLYRKASALGGLSTIDGVDQTVLASFALVFALFFGAIDVVMMLERQAHFSRRSNVLYAVSDRRILFWIPEKREGKIRIISIYEKELSGVSRSEGPDDSGDLIFSLRDGSYPNYVGTLWFQSSFLGVPEVRRVERIVRQNLINIDKAQEA